MQRSCQKNNTTSTSVIATICYPPSQRRVKKKQTKNKHTQTKHIYTYIHIPRNLETSYDNLWYTHSYIVSTRFGGIWYKSFSRWLDPYVSPVEVKFFPCCAVDLWRKPIMLGQHPSPPQSRPCIPTLFHNRVLFRYPQSEY